MCTYNFSIFSHGCTCLYKYGKTIDIYIVLKICSSAGIDEFKRHSLRYI